MKAKPKVTTRRAQSDYTTRKLHQAVLCLIGPGSLNERLIEAALPLGQALSFEQQGAVRKRIEEVLAELEKKPNRGHGSAAATVYGMRPQRAWKLAQSILDLYLFAIGAD